MTEKLKYKTEIISKTQQLRHDIFNYVISLGFLSKQGLSLFTFPLILPEKIPLKLEVIISKNKTLITFYQSEFEKDTIIVENEFEKIKKEINNRLISYIEKKAGSLKLLYEKINKDD